MATGHLVADLDLPLHRDVDLDELDDPGRQLVAAFQPPNLFIVQRLKDFDLLLRPPLHVFQFFLLVRIAEDDVAHRVVGQALEDLGSQLALLLENDVSRFRIHQIAADHLT